MTNEEYVHAVIGKLVIPLDLCDSEIHWNRRWDFDAIKQGQMPTGDEPIYAFVNCSDFFEYACADGETIEPDDIDDIRETHRKFGDEWGLLLWASRKRGTRPLRACYRNIPPQLWKEFDKCGPKRDR